MTTDEPHERSIPVAVIKKLHAEYTAQPLTTITVTEQQKTQYKEDKSWLALWDETPRNISDPVMVGTYCWAYDQVKAAAEGERHSVRCLTNKTSEELPSLTLPAQRRAELEADETTTVSVTGQQLAEINLRKSREGNLDGRYNGLSSPELFELLRRAYQWFAESDAKSDYKLPA